MYLSERKSKSSESIAFTKITKTFVLFRMFINVNERCHTIEAQPPCARGKLCDFKPTQNAIHDIRGPAKYNKTMMYSDIFIAATHVLDNSYNKLKNLNKTQYNKS